MQGQSWLSNPCSTRAMYVLDERGTVNFVIRFIDCRVYTDTLMVGIKGKNCREKKK